MKRSVILVLVAMVALASCNKVKQMAEVFDLDEDEAEGDTLEAFVGDTLHLFEEQEPPEAADKLFDDFFYNFIDDARFRSGRVALPLPVMEGEEQTTLGGGEWDEVNHLHDLEVCGVIYEREHDLQLAKDTTVFSVDVEWIDLSSERMDTYEFRRAQGKWVLTAIRREDWKTMPNADFLNFFSQFVADSAFRRQSLAEPMRLVLTPTDDEDEEKRENISPDDWFNMEDDLPILNHSLVNIDYGQACISQNRKTLLLEGPSNGLMMKFHFDRRGDNWKLIEIEY